MSNSFQAHSMMHFCSLASFALQYTRAVFQAIVKDPTKATPKKKSSMTKESDSGKKPADPVSSRLSSEQEKTCSEQDATTDRDKQSDEPPLTIPSLLPLMHSETAEGVYTRMTVAPWCWKNSKLLLLFSIQVYSNFASSCLDSNPRNLETRNI